MTNDTLTISRELADIRKLAELACGTSRDSPAYMRFLAAMNPTLLLDLTAAPVVERQEPVVIDLDAVDWETIQQAADESNWMPNEYMRNEWVADVCNFLKYGRADTSPPAPVAVALPECKAEEDDEPYMLGEAYRNGWNDCLDKVKEMNQCSLKPCYSA